MLEAYQSDAFGCQILSGPVGEVLARGSKRPIGDTKFDVRANSPDLYEINQLFLISGEFVQTIDKEAEAATCAFLVPSDTLKCINESEFRPDWILIRVRTNAPRVIQAQAQPAGIPGLNTS